MKKVVPSQLVELIRDSIPNIVEYEVFSTDSSYGPLFKAVVTLADDIPDELIALSGKEHSDYVLALEALLNQVDRWIHRGGDETPRSINGRHPLRVVWQLLQKCPDARPSPKTAEMKFIKDRKLRESIRIDLGSASNAHHDSEWKICHGHGGSCR